MKAFEAPHFSRKSSEQVATDSQEAIYERIAEHSRDFDRDIAAHRLFPEKEIKESWRATKWQIGEMTVQALGVAHVPETFLEFREEIERAIRESDIVVNEFAPEAQGLYDPTQAAYLSSVPSRFNERYNLEQLRQIYMKFERLSNIGTFHHEIEVLAAKHQKDMAVADLALVRDTEEFLQSSYFYADRAEEVEANQVRLKKMGVYGSATAVALGSLWKLLQDIQRPISRRNFLRAGLVVASAVAAGSAAQFMETPPSKASKTNARLQYTDPNMQMRDIRLAQALQKLSAMGYKKVAFIYGVGHLRGVEQYLSQPKKLSADSVKLEEDMKNINPDSFRIYQLSPGQNTSEKFVASPNKIWKRMAVK